MQFLIPTTIRKKRILILVTALLLVSAVIFFVSRRKAASENDDQVFVQAVSVKLPNGWGYDIMAGEKKYIHQAQIPGIPGRIPFMSEEEALNTGRLVVYKIVHNKMPSVSVAELDSLGVSWKK